MSSNETLRLGMPLLQPAQAQKHVTVNEALMRLDALVNLVLQSTERKTPPETVVDGQCWAVPAGAEAEWSGESGHIAIAANNGWVFAEPKAGMRAFVIDRGVHAICTGDGWALGATSLGGLGSALVAGMDEREFFVGNGAVMVTPVAIPEGAMVIGAVARVIEPLGGSVSSWSLGTEGATNRFGSGLGTAAGSWARGLLGSPMSYYEKQFLHMSADSGEFNSGKVRLAVHWWELRLPTN